MERAASIPSGGGGARNGLGGGRGRGGRSSNRVNQSHDNNHGDDNSSQISDISGALHEGGASHSLVPHSTRPYTKRKDRNSTGLGNGSSSASSAKSALERLQLGHVFSRETDT
jgi:hypothetical protein